MKLTVSQIPALVSGEGSERTQTVLGREHGYTGMWQGDVVAALSLLYPGS